MIDRALCCKFYQSRAYAWNCEFYRSQVFGLCWAPPRLRTLFG